MFVHVLAAVVEQENVYDNFSVVNFCPITTAVIIPINDAWMSSKIVSQQNVAVFVKAEFSCRRQTLRAR